MNAKSLLLAAALLVLPATVSAQAAGPSAASFHGHAGINALDASTLAIGIGSRGRVSVGVAVGRRPVATGRARTPSSVGRVRVF